MDGHDLKVWLDGPGDDDVGRALEHAGLIDPELWAPTDAGLAALEAIKPPSMLNKPCPGWLDDTRGPTL